MKESLLLFGRYKMLDPYEGSLPPFGAIKNVGFLQRIIVAP